MSFSFMRLGQPEDKVPKPGCECFLSEHIHSQQNDTCFNVGVSFFDNINKEEDFTFKTLHTLLPFPLYSWLLPQIVLKTFGETVAFKGADTHNCHW